MRATLSVLHKFFFDRMLVWVENQGVYEVDPMTRKILYTLPSFKSIENNVFLGSCCLSVVVDPEERYTTVTVHDMYTAKSLGTFRFRSIFTEWNALFNEEPPDPVVQSNEL